MSRFEESVKIYQKYGVDVEKALETVKNIPIALHCWQGDDVLGFEGAGALTGGIQTTGNYVGRARTPEELMADMELAMKLCPGKKKINVHASYAIMNDENRADRDALKPEHFKPWVDFAKKFNAGIDFNPTYFSHPKVKDGLTLTSPDEETRKFWIEHGKRCVEISEYFAKETGVPCVMNIWIGDGFKDVPADRMGPRLRYKDSLEQILSVPYDKNLVKPCVESKVFGIGVFGISVKPSVNEGHLGLIYSADLGKIAPYVRNKGLEQLGINSRSRLAEGISLSLHPPHSADDGCISVLAKLLKSCFNGIKKSIIKVTRSVADRLYRILLYVARRSPRSVLYRLIARCVIIKRRISVSALDDSVHFAVAVKSRRYSYLRARIQGAFAETEADGLKISHNSALIVLDQKHIFGRIRKKRFI